MRVLYIIRSIGHFSYHESTIRHLCSNGHSVEVLFDQGRSTGWPDQPVRTFMANTEGLTVSWSIRRNDLWRRPLFASRELLSYASYLTRKDQHPFYRERWQCHIPMPVRFAATRSERVRAFLARESTQSKLRTFERLVPPDAAITRWLRNNRPDVAVASPINMKFSEDVEYVKAAKALGIPTVVPVLSWDNLTTKGLFHAIPDLTLVWNQAQFNEAVSIHHVPASRIVITGSPFLDKWFEPPQLSFDKTAFCNKVGLDPNRLFVLYLGSSANIARDESWLVLQLAISLLSSRDKRLREMMMLVRPHGANQNVYKKISAPNVKVWFRDNELPDTPESFAEFAASLRYSACVVGLNTTGMVDALLADRPVIALLVEEYQNTNALQAVHFRYLLNADVYERADTTERCAEVITDLLDNQDSKKENRHEFVLECVRPHGLHRPAGEVAAQAIELAALGKSAAEIDSDIDSAELARDRGCQ